MQKKNRKNELQQETLASLT